MHNLIVHGGHADNEPHQVKEDTLRKRQAALKRILEEGLQFLETHSALQTVVHAVKLFEDDPLFNAGTGAKLQADGRARLSAAVMDGNNRHMSGLINIENVRHPVELAHKRLGEPFSILAAEYAIKWARSIGEPEYNPITAYRREEWRRKSVGKTGTVGACAVDKFGNLAAATSTGGVGMEQPGRVSDSPTPCGNFANPVAAISCTGIGEHILDEGLAVKIATRAEDGGNLDAAMQKTLKECDARKRSFGVIGMDKNGTPSWGAIDGMLYYATRIKGKIVLTEWPQEITNNSPIPPA